MAADSPVESVEITDILTDEKKKVEIPQSLRELGEIPQGFVPVYIGIDPESVDHVAEYGLRTHDNRWFGRNAQVEGYLDDAGRRMNAKILRTECVYAYPEDPRKTGRNLTNQSE